ncbi:MAG TPA: hypothetical protein VFZ91_04700 [Allosphingosinicella sp.]
MWKDGREKVGPALRTLVVVAGVAFWVWMVWTISWETARDQIEANYAARDYAESTNRQIKERCIGLPSAAAAECAAVIVSASRENQRGEYDLSAQRDMARWTRIMSILAGLGLGLSMVGVGLVYVTFGETRKAAAAAQRTYEAFVAVERPRLIPQVQDVSYDEKRRRMIITLKAENIGKSTGYVERVGYATSTHNGPPGPMVMEPVEVTVPADDSNLLTELESAPDFDTYPYISGVILYRSPFERDHQSYFCFRIEPGKIDAYGGGGPKAHRDRSGAYWPADT